MKKKLNKGKPLGNIGVSMNERKAMVRKKNQNK